MNKLLKRVLPQWAKTFLWKMPGMRTIRRTDQRVYALQEGIRRTLPQLRLARFELNVLDHCNLRCKGCDHFAAIAPERFVSMESITRDLARMSALFDAGVGRIEVLGGEPLLHPRLEQILAETRKYFPQTVIQLVTNGLLLTEQKEAFWATCRENRIVLVVTRYPVDVDYEAAMKMADENDVVSEYYGDTGRTRKTSWKVPLDLSGSQDARRSFVGCSFANNNVMVMEGKIYTCTVAPNIHIFNEVYGTSIPVTSGDYMDIHEAGGGSDVLDFLAKPKPLCCYCNVAQRSYGHRWERSSREMSEWTL